MNPKGGFTDAHALRDQNTQQRVDKCSDIWLDIQWSSVDHLLQSVKYTI